MMCEIFFACASFFRRLGEVNSAHGNFLAQGKKHTQNPVHPNLNAARNNQGPSNAAF
jgi:hypothetical protein